MPDRISRYRVAKLCLYPPHKEGFPYRYALVTNVIKNGIPTGSILFDGSLPNGTPKPTLPALLEAFDSVIRQNTLDRG